MKKCFLFFAFCSPFLATNASEKNKHLYEILHSPVKGGGLRAAVVKSLEHPHWRGTFVEAAPQTPERLGKFFTRKAKNGIAFLQRASNNQSFNTDCAELKGSLPAGESPLKNPTFKESPSRVLAHTLNFAMAVDQLRPNATRGDITEKALIMRRKARENQLYVKGRKLSDLFNKMDKEEKEAAESAAHNQPQNAPASASQPHSNSQPSAVAFVPNNGSSAPSSFASPIASSSAPSANRASSASSSPNLSRGVVAIAAKSISVAPRLGIKQTIPAKKKKLRNSRRQITNEKIEKERKKKKSEFKKASVGTQNLATLFANAQ